MFSTNYDYRYKLTASLTRKMKRALDYLKNSFSVVIEGGPGEGKTVCAYRLVKELIESSMIRLERCVLICDPNQIEHVKAESVDLIFIDNMFGKHNADPSKLSNWRNYFDTLESLVLNHKVRIIMASRMHILLEYKHELDVCKIFSNKVHLNSAELSKNEKQEILKYQLNNYKRKMEENEVEKCILQDTSEIGFPLCCQLFSSDEKFLPKAEFFKPSYRKFLDDNLKVLDKNQLVAFAYAFCSGHLLKRTDLRVSAISKESKAMLSNISELYGICMSIETLVNEASQNIEFFKGSYFKEISDDISFLHETMYEAVARLLYKNHPEVVIGQCTIDFLCQCVGLENTPNNEGIVVEKREFESLADRCINEVVTRHNSEKISKHPMLMDTKFVEILFKRLSSRDDLLRDFFCVGVTLKHVGIHGFLYHILLNEQMNEAFYCELKRYLMCDHSSEDNKSCWKCQVKTEALAAVCGSNKQDTYTELRDEGVIATNFCLFKAAENPHIDPNFLEKILHDVKESNSFALDPGYVQMAAGILFSKRSKSALHTLKSNSLVFTLTVHALYFAVQTGDVDFVSSTLNALIQNKRWIADNYFVSRAMLKAQVAYNRVLLNIMEKNGAKDDEGAIYWAVVDHGYKEVVLTVKNLKEKGMFDCESNHLAWALAVAAKNSDRQIYNFLMNEGVVATPALVRAMAELGESVQEIKNVITELQKSGRWDKNNHYIACAYMVASKRANKTLEAELTGKGVSLGPGCFYQAVIWYSGDAENIMEALKSKGRFDPLDTSLARALVWSVENRQPSYVSWLLDSGLCFNMACLVNAVDRSFSLSTLETVINKIKASGSWDTTCDYALEALNVAWIRRDKTAYEKLIDEGIKWTPRNLSVSVKYETVYGLKQVLRKLDEIQMLNKCLENKEAIKLAKSLKNSEKYREIRKMIRFKQSSDTL